MVINGKLKEMFVAGHNIESGREAGGWSIHEDVERTAKIKSYGTEPVGCEGSN